MIPNCWREPRPSCDVILNGGKAAVRDRTSAESFDIVNRNTKVAQTAMLNGDGAA
jgi:hypothetical protein